MDEERYRHVETTTVAAPPDQVYELVADVTRMGEWSPVCTGCTWDDDAHTWFTGTNVTAERTWQTRCRVDVAVPGSEFTFVNCGRAGDADLVRWSYTLTPAPGGGTTLSESWEVVPGYVALSTSRYPGMDVVGFLDGMVEPTRKGMALTLARIKAAAES